MIKFGICSNLVATGADKTGVEIVERIAEYGYDYIELPLAEMMELSDEQFRNIRNRVEKTSIRCETDNNFFPPYVKLTGPDASRETIKDYYERALDRAASLGVQLVVFGSGGAKRVPEGFSREKAYEQVVDVTDCAGAAAAKRGITIAIEPIRMPDCNIINTFEEGVALAKTVNRDNVKVEIDYYHMVCEHESAQILHRFGKDYLAHIHFAYPNIPIIDGERNPDAIRMFTEPQLEKKDIWRTFPSLTDNWDYSEFVTAVKAAEFNGHLSLEAGVHNFDEQAKAAIAFLKKTFR